MKRRLSVAISFMGSPSVVYLDEPSTVRAAGRCRACHCAGVATRSPSSILLSFQMTQGLDPGSRRNLWDVVKQGKKGRGIVLTTHRHVQGVVVVWLGLCCVCDHLDVCEQQWHKCLLSPSQHSRLSMPPTYFLLHSFLQHGGGARAV